MQIHGHILNFLLDLPRFLIMLILIIFSVIILHAGASRRRHFCMNALSNFEFLFQIAK